MKQLHQLNCNKCFRSYHQPAHPPTWRPARPPLPTGRPLWFALHLHSFSNQSCANLKIILFFANFFRKISAFANRFICLDGIITWRNQKGLHTTNIITRCSAPAKWGPTIISFEGNNTLVHTYFPYWFIMTSICLKEWLGTHWSISRLFDRLNI